MASKSAKVLLASAACCGPLLLAGLWIAAHRPEAFASAPSVRIALAAADDTTGAPAQPSQQTLPQSQPPTAAPANPTRLPGWPFERPGRRVDGSPIPTEEEWRQTVALFSDWGTGEETARRVMRQIKLQNPTHAVHLGDVYYSGTEKEIQRRFLDIIDAEGPSPTTCTYLALNSNHEMYSGGHAYFELTLKTRFQQEASYFNLRNAHWQLIGLTVFLALIGVVAWGSLAGSMLPFALRRLGFDPATSSAPFVATLVDVTGLIIYFMVAKAVLTGTVM
jgi:hypothetical protein